MAFTIKMRFPLLLLLGVVFLALVCASSSSRISSHEGEEGLPPHHRETGGQRERAHQEGEREEEERHHHQPRHHQSHEKEQREEDEEEERQHHHRPQHKREQREEEDEGRQPRREQEPEEEEERQHRRRPQRGEREEEKEREHRRERHRGRDEEYSSEEDDEEGSSSEYSLSRGRKNPFYFSSSNRFETIFKNENGRIRLLERLDKRNSNLFQNLQKYRLAEFRLKPRTLLLPQHIDADLLLVVLKGKAILTVVNQTDKNSFNLENGDAIKIPAGTLAYLANRDDKRDLKVVHLVIPVNSPTRIQTFFPSSNQNQQSYFQGFSRGILEASFNTNFEEIEKVLLQEEQRKQKQGQGQGQGQGSQEANIIVKVSRELIEELSKDAKSSSTKPPFSKSEPFRIQSRPIYSNEFGRFSEITSNQTPQLEDLDLFLSLAEIKEGALFLPHYNSRANIILVVTEGRGNIELVGVKNEGQKQENLQDEEDEGNRQVQRFSARLTPGDVFIIPSSHPVAVNASSNLSIVGFGINAENNERNFLTGEEDNVIRQIHEPVKELAFPGSAQEVDRLLKNQRQSYFANAQPQQREEESQRKRVLLSSI